MLKWEHLTVIIRFNHQNGKIRETVIGGRTRSYLPEEQCTIQQYLAELAKDNWDLVGIVGIDTYLFSRRSRNNTSKTPPANP